MENHVKLYHEFPVTKIQTVRDSTVQSGLAVQGLGITKYKDACLQFQTQEGEVGGFPHIWG